MIFIGIRMGQLVATLLVVFALVSGPAIAGGADTGERKENNAAATTAQRTGANGVRLINPSLYVARPPAGKSTPQRQPSLEQNKILAGDYPLATVLEAGQNQFNLPFAPANGHGEGRSGPRSLQRRFWNPRGATFEQDSWPFLRVNGIDSQSCFECHNTIGEAVPDGAKTLARVRKPGAQGGPAGAANSAFINDQFPEYSGQPNSVMTKFVRNPPPVFGTGYTQRLATEMSSELRARAHAARVAATRTPGTRQMIALVSKGVDFGSFATTCKGDSVDTCNDDTSVVVGVQGDLVVRPFQWGGIASSVRHFARDALDFHFSVQAVEKVGHKDCDLDGLVDEITVGNVTALASYVAMFRPPSQVIEPGMQQSVERGRQLIEQVGCTDCHSAKMTIDVPTLTVMTPPVVPADAACPEEISSLINPVPKDDHHAIQKADQHLAGALARAELAATDAATTPEQIYALLQPHLHKAGIARLAEGNFQIDLNLGGFSADSVPAYVWPRLPAQADGSVEVPLFSDLKLHYMGKMLADDFAQPVDVEGYAAEPG
ncbi:MAG: hypothetical protein ABR550_02240, partial [Wenzhouxiangellaceae bacterium]